MSALPARPITVLKLGSSVLSSEEDFPIAVREIRRVLESGHSVLAVVSACGDTTDRLLSKARRAGEDPDSAALATLLSTGEAACAALLTFTLQHAGLPAALVGPSRAGLRTKGPLLDAEPCGLDTDGLHALLRERAVCVLPGFFGLDESGDISLLGRGGSDLTALFVAHRLGATCRLLKDVDGIHDSDPAISGASRRYDTLSWDEAIRLDAPVVQGKALAFACKNGVAFEVCAPGAGSGTRIGPWPTRLHDEILVEVRS
jgi:homoserine dehydrogenase